MNTVNVVLDNDPVDEIFGLFNETKKSQPTVFTDDPVALSCAAYRLGNYPRLTDVTPNDEDRVFAEKIRRHFMDKLVVQRLRGQPMSDFREKLGAFLVDNRPLLDSELGILYQLPHFYVEDIETQSLIENTTEVSPSAPEHRKETLRPYKQFTLKRKGGAIRQYWWVDAASRPYCLNIRESTDHQPLYQSIWNFDSIQVEAHMYVKSFRGTSRFYYKLVGTRLLGVA